VRRAFIGALLLAWASASFADLVFPRDGWATWQVQTDHGAPNWCCFQWKNKPMNRMACDLDGRQDGYGSSNPHDTVDTMSVYARFVNGKVEKMRVLGPACEVTTRTPVRDLGVVAPEESARWLKAQLPDADKRLLDDILAALSVHRGSAPTMIRLATTDANPRLRAQAWFWLSQVSAPQMEAAIKAALQTERDRHVREQAIFALSQLPAERAAKALAALIEDPSLPREDRKHALFWMGQIDSDFAVSYLDKLLTK